LYFEGIKSDYTASTTTAPQKLSSGPKVDDRRKGEKLRKGINVRKLRSLANV